MAQSKSMGNSDIKHPEKPSAVGSRNSTHRDNRDEYQEAKLMVDEQVDKILNHVSAKLPPEVLDRLHVGGTVKEKLHNYLNQGYQNMFNRYLVTAEDELTKKYKTMVDEEELKSLNKYTPREVTSLLKHLGKDKNFDISGIDSSVTAVYSQLQKSLNKEITDLNHQTDKVLRGKTDISSLIKSDGAYSIVKCYFRDNSIKPEAVTDISLAVNVTESELLKPIFHYQNGPESILKEIISGHIMTSIDKEIQDIDQQMGGKALSSRSAEDRVVEKMNRLEQHISFENSEDSKQYDYVAHRLLNTLQGMGEDEHAEDDDPLSIRDNIRTILGEENIRNKGFDDVVNTLINILNDSHLSFQHIDNFRNARKVVIQEYSDFSSQLRPDESYQISLSYLDSSQLREMRTSYCQQLDEFEAEALKLKQVFEKVYQGEKEHQGVVDFEDISKQFLTYKKSGKGSVSDHIKDDNEESDNVNLWDEISFLQPHKDDYDKVNETFDERRSYLKKKFLTIRERIQELYEFENPPERVILEQRLDFLEDSFSGFNRGCNPFHIQPGLLIELALSTIKKQEITVDCISQVLNCFLNTISKWGADSKKDLGNYLGQTDLEEVNKKYTFVPTPEMSASL